MPRDTGDRGPIGDPWPPMAMNSWTPAVTRAQGELEAEVTVIVRCELIAGSQQYLAISQRISGHQSPQCMSVLK